MAKWCDVTVSIVIKHHLMPIAMVLLFAMVSRHLPFTFLRNILKLTVSTVPILIHGDIKILGIQ